MVGTIPKGSRVGAIPIIPSPLPTITTGSHGSIVLRPEVLADERALSNQGNMFADAYVPVNRSGARSWSLTCNWSEEETAMPEKIRVWQS